ncbi:MAG TPA: hypothetical protein VFI15_03310 [Candidatus Limnocylindrales bacterium]|nr:hypothetical protein [Candidatus Limnocylindrales bacterium]
MGRGFTRVVAALGIAALALAASGCGNAQPADPYVTLDRAISVGWQQVTANLGVAIDVPAQNVDGFTSPATAIHIDPAMVQATIDTQTGRWHITTSIPLAALGMDQQLGPFGFNFGSIDVEALFDGTAYYAKSPLLPLYLQGALANVGSPIDGDLTGWVKLGTAEDLQQLGSGGMFPLGFGNPGENIALPLPSPGAPAALQAFVEDFGIALVAAGRETSDGLEMEHLSASLNLAKLAESRTLASITGFGKDQLQGVFDSAKQVSISAELWADTGAGRLRTLRIDARTLSAPLATVAIVLQLTEPAAGTTFDAPATFTDVPLVQLMNTQVNGIVEEVGNELPPPDLETFETLGP